MLHRHRPRRALCRDGPAQLADGRRLLHRRRALPVLAADPAAKPAAEKKYARDWDQYVKLAGDTESAIRIRELWVDLNHRPKGIDPGFLDWVRFYNLKREMKYPGTDRHIYAADFVKILEDLGPQGAPSDCIQVAAVELPDEPTKPPDDGAIATGKEKTIVRSQGRTHIYKPSRGARPEFNIRDPAREMGENVQSARAIKIMATDGRGFVVGPGMSWDNKKVLMKFGRRPMYQEITMSENGPKVLENIHNWIEDHASDFKVG